MVIVKIRFQRQFSQAYYPVHGGPDFMTHVGQELAFGDGGRFSSVALKLQSPLHQFLLADIVAYVDVVGNDAQLVPQRSQNGKHGVLMSVAMPQQEFTAPAVARIQL